MNREVLTHSAEGLDPRKWLENEKDGGKGKKNPGEWR